MRVRVDDVSLWYDVLSPAVVPVGDHMHQRPVIVGVHGGPGIDSASLATALAPLTDSAQVIRHDQRGHGRSDGRRALGTQLQPVPTPSRLFLV